MHKRFYVCPVREIASDPSDPTDISWRPILHPYIIGHPGVWNMAAQTPLGPDAWALVSLEFRDDDHSDVLADVEIDELPDDMIDIWLPLEHRSKVQAIFDKYKVSGTIRASEALRGLLGRIARQANPKFNQDDWF